MMLTLHLPSELEYRLAREAERQDLSADEYTIHLSRMDDIQDKFNVRVAEDDALELYDMTVGEAEVHWFEAHGVGRKDFKIKRILR